MRYLLIGDVDGCAIQMYYNLFEFIAPAISRLLLVTRIYIGIINRIWRVRPILENSLTNARGGYGPNVGTYWSNPQTCNHSVSMIFFVLKKHVHFTPPWERVMWNGASSWSRCSPSLQRSSEFLTKSIFRKTGEIWQIKYGGVITRK